MDQTESAPEGIPQITVEVVRVFTNSDGRYGNELGILWATEHTAGREQQIAHLLGFSETVFVDHLTESEGDRLATIRIFTPAAELPFAGHPSVGAAWWLRQRDTPVVTLVEKAGDVAVGYTNDFTWISAEAAWAPEFEWMPLATPAEVAALDPAAFDRGHHYAWAWLNESEGRIVSRMFAPDFGIVEDEATGSAAVRITATLARDLLIEQGQGSRLATRIGQDNSVQVGGRTVFDRTIVMALPPAS